MEVEQTDSGLLVVRNRCVAVLEGVEHELLNDPDRLLVVGRTLAVEDLGLDIRDEFEHRFPPRNSAHYGATQGFILGESHLIWSTWPERDELEMDIFSCSPDVDLTQTPIYLARRYHPGAMRFSTTERPPYIPMPS